MENIHTASITMRHNYLFFTSPILIHNDIATLDLYNSRTTFYIYIYGTPDTQNVEYTDVAYSNLIKRIVPRLKERSHGCSTVSITDNCVVERATSERGWLDHARRNHGIIMIP